MEDIYEPMNRYRDEFRDRFARETELMFQKLLAKSKVDEGTNQILIDNIERLSSEVGSLRKKSTLWLILIIFLVILIVGGVILTVVDISNRTFGILGGIGITAVILSGVSLFMWVVPAYRKVTSHIRNLDTEIQETINEAWVQMKPLNDLFKWDIPTRLIEKVFPTFQFDPFFSTCRLADMKLTYGWDDEFNQERSVVYAHSGHYNGNPFVLSDMKQMNWEMKVYTGTRTITWTERERGTDGQMRTVSRSQTLVAKVEKPVPVFSHDKILLYGHEAAPNLSFSRDPSEHSGSGDGFFAKLGKKWEIGKLRKLSQNLDDDLDFTMMSNEEFELLFHGINRNHEVEYRLLFTPLAQQQMVKLLKDKEIGFGDDFSFYKIGMMNMIRANNLTDIDLVTAPERFRHYSLKQVREYFQTANEAFFKSFYFTFAPLLTVPIYQQERGVQFPDLKQYENKASFWEHEAVANYYGDARLSHPACQTETIMKATAVEDLPDGATKLTIHSSGYYGEDRVDHITVYGNDGRYHTVPVEWIEYLPAERDSQIILIEDGDPTVAGDVERVNGIVDFWKKTYRDVIHYRQLYACIVD